jgi:hypothetical protein
MDGTAIVTAATAISVAALSYLFAKRRERDAEWRKLKLDHYKEFVSALSGVVGERSNAATQARFSDAINAMVLVAPPPVLRALYAFHDEVRVGNKSRSQDGHDRTLKALLEDIRRDVHPSTPDDSGITFRLLDAPSDDEALRRAR